MARLCRSIASGSVDASQVERARTYFSEPDRHLGKRFSVEMRAQIARRLLGHLDGARLIDLGCGDGTISLQFTEARELTLIDVSENMLARAQAALTPVTTTRAVLRLGDAFSMDLAPPYDVVLMIGLLAHVDSVDQALARAADLLVPGGRLVAQLTDADHPIARLLTATARRRLRTVGYQMHPTALPAVKRAAAKAGLVVVTDFRYATALPGMGRLPSSWLSAYQRLLVDRPSLRRVGWEHLILFVKEAPSPAADAEQSR